MEKLVKKYANGGGYYVTVKSPHPAIKKVEPKVSPLKGWNIPVLKPENNA